MCQSIFALNIEKVVMSLCFPLEKWSQSNLTRRSQAESKSSLWLRLKVEVNEGKEVLSSEGEVGEEVPMVLVPL